MRQKESLFDEEAQGQMRRNVNFSSGVSSFYRLIKV
jgi:hypothetical protein